MYLLDKIEIAAQRLYAEKKKITTCPFREECTFDLFTEEYKLCEGLHNFCKVCGLIFPEITIFKYDCPCMILGSSFVKEEFNRLFPRKEV